MSNNKQSSLLSELKEYIAEKIISIAFSLMPMSKVKIKYSKFILETFGGNNEQ